MINNEEWTLEASCADPELKFAELFHNSSDEAQDRAKALCGACPVKQLCIQYALNNEERFGRWGASEAELRRAQAINAKGEANPSKHYRIRCPNCGPYSTKNLEVVERKRTRSHIRCTVCTTEWWARKSISPIKRNF